MMYKDLITIQIMPLHAATIFQLYLKYFEIFISYFKHRKDNSLVQTQKENVS